MSLTIVLLWLINWIKFSQFHKTNYQPDELLRNNWLKCKINSLVKRKEIF